MSNYENVRRTAVAPSRDAAANMIQPTTGGVYMDHRGFSGP